MNKAALVSLALGLLVTAVAGAQNVGGGDVTFSPRGVEPVVFSHQVHVDVKGIKCSACHYHVFQMSKDSFKMDMSKITKGDFCGKCHNRKKAFDVNDPANCIKCHRK